MCKISTFKISKCLGKLTIMSTFVFPSEKCKHHDKCSTPEMSLAPE